MASLNISKSDHDLAEWSGGSCAQRKHIAQVTIQVKAKYGLSTDPAERLANEAALAGNCVATSVDQSDQTTGSTSSISFRSTRSPEQSVTVPIPSFELPERWTAAYLFSQVTEHGVIALWKWTGLQWLHYAEVGGYVVPGSTNFTVGAHDTVLITLE